MTDPFIEEIKKRVEAATPGPWDLRNTTDKSKTAYVFLRPGYFVWPQFIDNEVTAMLAVKPNMESDANFIAHARTDIPKLLALVELYEEGLLLLKSYEANIDEMGPIASNTLLEGEKIKRRSDV